MTKLSKKGNQDLQMVTIMIFVVSFFLIFAIRPSLALIFTLFKEREEYQQIDRSLENKIQEIILAQTNFMEAINKKKVIEEAIPETHQLEQIKTTLNDQFPLLEFNLSSLSILPAPKNQIVVLPITFVTELNYSQFNKLLKTLYQSPRLFKIINLGVMQKNQEASASAVLGISVKLETYYLPK